MPTITKIERQRQRENRFSIYLDDKYSFSLTDLDLSLSGLRVGDVLGPDVLRRYQDQSIVGKAYDRALSFLSYRPRSEMEVRQYLVRKDIAAEVIEPVIERLRQNRFIDDVTFAESWIASRQRLKPRSRRMLEQELRQKGLDNEVIQTALAAVDTEVQLDTLIELIERKRLLARYDSRDKLIGYLGRQGFPYDQIKEALTRLESES